LGFPFWEFYLVAKGRAGADHVFSSGTRGRTKRVNAAGLVELTCSRRRSKPNGMVGFYRLGGKAVRAFARISTSQDRDMGLPKLDVGHPPRFTNQRDTITA